MHCYFLIHKGYEFTRSRQLPIPACILQRESFPTLVHAIHQSWVSLSIKGGYQVSSSNRYHIQGPQLAASITLKPFISLLWFIISYNIPHQVGSHHNRQG